MNKSMQQVYKASERTFKCRHDSLVQRLIPQRNLTDLRHQRTATIPDFLLPSFAPQRPTPKNSSLRTPPFQTQAYPRIFFHHERQFSTSARRNAVVVAANPRKDDQGNDMLVDITPRAANVCLKPTVFSHHRSLTNVKKPSASKKSWPKTRTLPSSSESRYNLAVATGFSTSCLLFRTPTFLVKKIQCSKLATGQAHVW